MKIFFSAAFGGSKKVLFFGRLRRLKIFKFCAAFGRKIQKRRFLGLRPPKSTFGGPFCATFFWAAPQNLGRPRNSSKIAIFIGKTLQKQLFFVPSTLKTTFGGLFCATFFWAGTVYYILRTAHFGKKSYKIQFCGYEKVRPIFEEISMIRIWEK